MEELKQEEFEEQTTVNEQNIEEYADGGDMIEATEEIAEEGE